MALRSKAASKTEYNSRPFTKSNLAGRSFCLGVMPIPCPHFKITIVKRSQGQSAVAGAAYQSGERLFSEYDQRTKFYNKKKELVHAEIMLPSYAPPGYADRATLWNAVEAVENQWNSQLARRIVLAFPVEVPKEQYLKMIREFCQEQFVSKGMIADFAIHDKGDGNPHAHILLTLRAMDEHGKWLPKARKVYDLDENGERIQLPSGNWKCHKENTVDWNDQKYLEKQNIAPSVENYEILYRGNLPEGKRSVPQPELLEQLYQKFNCAQPMDYHGHSLSVSDVILLNQAGKISAHYVDSIGFRELSGFQDKQERSSVLGQLKAKCDMPEYSADGAHFSTTLTARCRSSFPLSTAVPIPAAAIRSISRKRMTTITASGTSLPGC